ncbi:hypothetical protein QFC20_007781 [Naganishia adeliensis]|uniref:Uncharacterized protein n=1 Tax=Naganishia adeliensis TaxID=92952 RepID=A0ACC2UW31_9TREE|nr:hypothetical protein QFC20_007781 [Naganishia adeliensis]
MLDDVVRYVLDEVAMDGSIDDRPGTGDVSRNIQTDKSGLWQNMVLNVRAPAKNIILMGFCRGTSPSRFIALFSRNSCPLNLANETDPPVAADPSDPNAEHSQSVTQEQEQEREHYAAYVWRMMVDLKAMRVVLLETGGGGTGNGGPSEQDQQIANGQDDPLETIDSTADFVLDPALAVEAQAAAAPAATTEPAATEAAPVPEASDLDADKYDLMLLKEKYGDKVVMRASEDEIMNALTGSYVRPSRLSNIVYTALQFIARGKEFGMSVLDIAKKTGQKPSTVFYLVKTLTDMGVAAKIKDTESNKTNIAVHRRYLSENFQYQLRMEHLTYLAEVAREDTKPDINDIEIEDNIPIDPSTGLPKFPPFGLESLGSRAFIKYRLIKLLKSDLWHHLIENRLLPKFMGFQPAYTLQARRQFQRHISALKREGLIDEVLVPDENIPDKPHRCLRLAEFRPKDNEKETFEGALPDILSTVIDPALIDVEELEDDDLLEDDDPLDETISPKELRYDYSYTIDHAVLQVVKGSGTQGVTIRQIMRQINNLDHKTVDVVVARYERLEHHPTQLNDFLFKVTQEVYGREKRLRVFTLENFRQRCLEDGIQLNDEIPTHPNIGRYADLSDYKLCKTQAEAKVALDFEWIGVPRACDKINKEHKKWTKRPPGMPRKAPKSKKGQDNQQDDMDPQVLGRPRKFIRTIGLDGKLVKRTKFNVIPVHPELPSVYLYNTETKVFFDVPADWDGVRPLQAPPDWDTATEPVCPIIPSTGLPARADLVKEIKKKQAAAEAKAKRSRKHFRDEDDDEHPPAPPKKKGRPKKVVDENATPPPPKKKGRAKKGDKPDLADADQAADQAAVGDQVETGDQTPEAPAGLSTTGKKTRPRKTAKSQAIASVEVESPAATPLEESEIAAHGTTEPNVGDVVAESSTSTRAASKRRGKANVASTATVDLTAADAMEVDASMDIPGDESHHIESLPIDDAMNQPSPEKHAQPEPEFELDPQLSAGTTALETAVIEEPALHSPGSAIPSAQQESVHTGTSPVAVTVVSPVTKKRSRPSNANPNSSAADTASATGEPDPKKAKASKWTKLVKPRGSLQHPYRKREILEFLRAAGGVTTGGYFLCVNIWEWIQTHKDGKSTFENLGAGSLMGTAGFAEVQRFQEALAALQKAEREAAAMAIAEGTGGGGTAHAIRGGDSNAAIPPTPKNEGVEGVKNRQLPGDGAALTASPPRINIKLADAAVTTPAPSSPIQEEAKLGSGSEPQGKPIGNLPALKEEEEVKDKGGKADADADAPAEPTGKDDHKMEVDNVDIDIPVKPIEPIDPRTAPENKDIGLHCWIVGTLQSEVDHAYAKVEELLAFAIKEYEAWLEEHGDERSDEEADEFEGKDVVMEGIEGAAGEGEVKKPVEVKL